MGNLINRYRAVLKKCALMNVFGSLAVAAMMVLGAPSGAAAVDQDYIDAVKEITTWAGGQAADVTGGKSVHQLYFGGSLAENGQNASVESSSLTLSSGELQGELNAGGTALGQGAVANVGSASITISGGTLTYMTDHPDGEYFAPVRGGGVSMNGGTADVDNAVINISDGARLDSVYTQVWAGGVNEDGLGSAHTGNAVINITNADLSENHVYGGSDMGSVGSSTINVSGSRVGVIFAGGDYDDVDSATINVGDGSTVYMIEAGGSTASIVKNSTVNVTGGVVGGNSYNTAITATEEGGVPENLAVNISGGTVNGDILARAVKQAEVSIEGNAPVLQGTIMAEAATAGLSLSNRDSFDGASFRGFDRLSVSGTTAIDGGLDDINVGTALALDGPGTVVSDVDLSQGALTVASGTLDAGSISLSGNGTLTVDGGTLKTSSDQAFTSGLGADGSQTDAGSVMNGLSFKAGRLALTDGLYNLAYMGSAESLLGDGVDLAMLGALKSGGNMVIGTNSGSEFGDVAEADTTEKSSATFETIALSGGDTVAVNNGNEVTLLGDGTHVITSDQGAATLMVGSAGQDVNGGTVNLGAAGQNGGGSLDRAVVSAEGRLNVVNGNFAVGELSGTQGGLITVGSDASAGNLTVGSADLNGATVFLDPVWADDPSVDILDNASKGVFRGTEINGNLIAGRNSLLVLGDADTAWAEAAFAETGRSWGRNGISAAAAVVTPQTLSAAGNLVLDGSLDSAPALTGTGNARFADGSLLMVAGDAAMNGNVALTGNGTGALTVEKGASLYIRDAAADTQYTVADKFASADIAGWNGSDLLLNRLVKGTTTQDENGHIVVSTSAEDVALSHPGIIPVNALNSMTTAVESPSMGVRFLSRAMDETMLDGNLVTDTVNEVSRAAVTAGVQNTSLRLADAASDTVQQHLSLSNFNDRNTIHEDGTDFWATPMYGNTYTHGMGVAGAAVRGNYGGLAFGADTRVGEIAGGRVRVGAAVNGGGGKSETRGTATSTENSYNFGGVNLYAGWNLGDLNVMAGVGYGMGSHDVKMNLPGSMNMGQAKADVDTGAFTADLRVEYQIKTDLVDILPHAGVRYTSLHTDSYDLKVNGSRLNSVSSDTQNIVQFPVGVTVTKDIEVSGWNVKPQLDVSVIPAAGDKKAFSKVNFAGLDAVDSVNTRIMDSTSFGGMLGLQAEKGNLALGVNYGVQAGRHETDQRVNVGISWKF